MDLVLGCTHGTHDGSESGVFDFDDWRKGWVLHDPEDGVGWLFELKLTVWSGKDGLNGTAVAIGDVLGDRDDLAIGIDGGADVLDGKEVFGLVSGERVVSGLIKVGKMEEPSVLLMMKASSWRTVVSKRPP